MTTMIMRRSYVIEFAKWFRTWDHKWPIIFVTSKVSQFTNGEK